MDYETVRAAVGVPPDEWAAIKSAGRQGVARAYHEGGAKKAKLKLAKMLAASARPTTAGTQALKKRRRRANERERVVSNRRGTLTDGQLYLLFANQQSNLVRLRGWLDDASVVRSKARRRERWATEYSEFYTQFAEHCQTAPPVAAAAGTAAAPTLFVASVSQAVLRPPDEAVAAKLWGVLNREQLTGARLGSVEQACAQI